MFQAAQPAGQAVGEKDKMGKGGRVWFVVIFLWRSPSLCVCLRSG